MTSELRPEVECELCAKLTPDMEQTAARMAAQIGGVMQCRECGRVYETQTAELAKFKALAETLAGALGEIAPHVNWLPHPHCLTVEQLIREALREYKEARDAKFGTPNVAD